MLWHAVKEDHHLVRMVRRGLDKWRLTKEERRPNSVNLQIQRKLTKGLYSYIQQYSLCLMHFISQIY